jgi:hypothetical protein
MATNNPGTSGNSSFMAIVVALIFAAVGVFAVLLWSMLGRRRKRQKEALAQARPAEPWLRKKAWADGRIRNSAASLVGPLVFAILWNAFCAPLWFILPGEAVHKGDRVAWLALAFPITGLVLACWAVVSVLRWRKFGRSVFQMASVPGVIGGQLAGVIRTRVKIEPENTFRIRLSCINCVTSRASRGHISRSIVWQDEESVARDLLQEDRHHSAIPVLFQIPYECRQTDDGDPSNIFLWSLEVTAKMPGLDYCAEFNVPVFKTPESDPHFVVDRNLLAKYIAPENPDRDLRDAGVVKTSSPTGDGCRFVFPMARCPRISILATLTSAVFFVAPILWLCLDFEFIAIPFAVVFGLVAAMLSIVAVNLWFYRSVVDASHRGLTVAGGLFGRGSPQWIEASEVAKIETVSHLKSEKLMYYDLVIVCRGGERLTAGKRLPGHRLAVSVVRQIEQAMGNGGDSGDRAIPGGDSRDT